MITDVTLKFTIPQAELDLYVAAAAAAILGTPKTRRCRWIYTVDLEDYDPADDEIAADCAGLTYWTDTLRRDLSDTLTQEQIELIEECLEVEIRTQPDDPFVRNYPASIASFLSAGRRAA